MVKNNTKTISKTKKSERILHVKTTQTGALKQVIERIANVISDCCIVFIPRDKTLNDPIDDYYEEVDEENKVDKGIGKKIDKKIDKKPIKKIIEELSDEESDSDIKNKNKKSKKITKQSSKKKLTKTQTKNQNKSRIKKSKEKIIESNELKNNGNKNQTGIKNVAKKNTGGIRILRLTEDKNILIKLNLDADNFEEFECLEPKIIIGVDMHNLHAMLKLVNDDDPITLYMNKDNRSALYIQGSNASNDCSEETDIEIYLMDIGNPEMPIPQTEFQNKITMASDKFHTICKHLNNNSTFVEITSINNEISFRGQNEGGKVTMSYKDIHITGKRKDKPEQVVQGVYELRNLMNFSKCNKLCNTIDIYLKNDFPLVLVISVATLGKMYIFLSPIENDVNK